MSWRERIVSDAHTPHGRVRVKGTRIPVTVVLDNLAAHVDPREVLASYPSLSEEDVRACVAWAAECAHAAEREADARTGNEAAKGFKDFLRSMPNVGDDADFDVRGSGAQALPEGQTLMDVLLNMPNVGDDADFERPADYGRELPPPQS